MKERPIIFSGPMVQAIPREINPKTQTRRTRGLEFINQCPDEWRIIRRLQRAEPIIGGGIMEFPGADESSWIALKNPDGLEDDGYIVLSCPYGQPGDRLWVRETWGGAYFSGSEFSGNLDCTPLYPKEDKIPKEMPDGFSLMYRADFKSNEDAGEGWFPSIHMPRWASRIILEIVSVRVQRVQEISEGDARAEGCRAGEMATRAIAGNARMHFAAVWDHIKRGFGWDVNPWVWAIEFKRIAGAG